MVIASLLLSAEGNRVLDIHKNNAVLIQTLSACLDEGRDNNAKKIIAWLDGEPITALQLW